MNDNLVTYEDIQAVSGAKSPAEAAAWLGGHSIPFFKGKNNRPSTTLKAFNAALGLEDNSDATSETQRISLS